jgi:hypothetical protein
MAFSFLKALARNVTIRHGVEVSLPALSAQAATTPVPALFDERAAGNYDGGAVVTGAWFMPAVTITAGATQPTLNLLRVNSTSGATVATVGTLALTSGTYTGLTAVAFSLTAANVEMLPGEMLVLQIVQPTSGAAVAAGHTVQVAIARPGA